MRHAHSLASADELENLGHGILHRGIKSAVTSNQRAALCDMC
jgi:hypothetical protein